MPWTVYNSDGKTLQSAEVGNNSITNAKMADDAIDSVEIVAGAVDLAHMSSQSVDEDNLYISNAGSNGEFLSKQSGNNGGLTWAAAGGGPTETNQSDMGNEGSSNADRYVSSETMKYAPSTAKAWINMHMVGTQTNQNSYNVSGIADNGVGKTTVSFSTNMSSGNYAIVGESNNQHTFHNHGAEQGATGFQFACLNDSHAVVDADDLGVVVFALNLV